MMRTFGNFAKIGFGLFSLTVLPMKSFGLGCIGEWPNQICAQAAPQAALLTCYGSRNQGRAGIENLTVTVVRTSFDEQLGIPVAVTVVSSIALKPLIDQAPGRLLGSFETQTSVNFAGGSMELVPGNSGITGTSTNLTGKLEMTVDGPGHDVTVGCQGM
jgi:hypothetical protein